MNVRVRLFAAARQAADRPWLDLEMPQGTTVGQVRRRLRDELPQLAALLKQAMFAIDAEYANDQKEIPPQADVACIPPVSGG